MNWSRQIRVSTKKAFLVIGQAASEGSVFPVRGGFEKRSNGQLQRLLKALQGLDGMSQRAVLAIINDPSKWSDLRAWISLFIP